MYLLWAGSKGRAVENEVRNTIPPFHDKFLSILVNADSFIFMLHKNMRNKVKFSFIIAV